jgi:D-sedoheptulose 7-phosphate isomerase
VVKLNRFGGHVIKSDLILTRILAVKSTFQNPDSFDVERIKLLAELVIESFRKGNKLIFVGNGGSAAEAIHLAAEFTGKCVVDHEPLPAISLNESQSSITAIANDYGVDQMFSRPAKALINKGDVLIAMSTSGKSKNIVNTLEVAKSKGADVILWMGGFDVEYPGIDIWRVPSISTPRIQEIHLVWGHVLAEVVELTWLEVSEK